jgi:hypothetical protein
MLTNDQQGGWSDETFRVAKADEHPFTTRKAD